MMIILLLASSYGNAQNVNFSGKEVSLKIIFSAIKQQTGIVFFYDENLMKEAKPVTVMLTNVTLETALNEIFKNQPLTWVLEDKTVTIIKRPVTIITTGDLPSNKPATILVKGNILDAEGNAISDVSISIKGKKQGTIADKNGRFSIQAEKKDKLLFSAVGYGTQEMIVQGNEMNIQLLLEIKPMEAYIVGGNLAAIKRKADATSVTIIDAQTLERLPPNTIDQVYRGVAPGTNSYDVGDAPEGLLTLSIRGAAGSSAVAPVAVYIDGIGYAGGSGFLCQLDKTNINRIEVVRGPGASTMYGTGSNAGIVQIFTNRPLMNQTAINMSAGAGFYESKWVQSNPVQQVYNLELSKGFKKTAFTVGGSYRTVGAYLPDGGEKNQGVYANAGFNLGKWQINITGRYNARNYDVSRNPFYDTAIHPRNDILIPGQTIPAFEWYNVIPSSSLHSNGLTETIIGGVNLSYNTSKKWVNNLVAGYTSNTRSEHPDMDGSPLQKIYQTFSYKTITIRYYNTIALGNSQTDFNATILSGLEFKQNSYTNVFFHTRTGLSNNFGDPDNKNYGAFVQLNPSYKNLYLTLGLRYEKNELFTAAWDPRIGLTTNFNLWSMILKPRISWGRGITAPSYTERFGIPATAYTIAYPNPGIKPQSQQGFDYGLEIYDNNARYKFEIVYYDNVLRNMINQIGLGPDPADTTIGGFISVNGGEIVNRGWELSGTYNFRHITLQGSFSIINSLVDDTTGNYLIPLIGGLKPGTRISNLPSHIAGLSLTYNFSKIFRAMDGGSVSVMLTEVDGVKYRDYRNYYMDIAYGRRPIDQTLSGYSVESPTVFRLGVYADYQIANGLRFFASGSNILNNYTYENSNEYPTHGATWLFGLKYCFAKTILQ